MKLYLTVPEAAEYLDCSQYKMRKYCDQGKVNFTRDGIRGSRRIESQSVVELKEKLDKGERTDKPIYHRDNRTKRVKKYLIKNGPTRITRLAKATNIPRKSLWELLKKGPFRKITENCWEVAE